jgi:hypothetical protein
MLTTLFSLPAHLLVEDVLIENQVLTLVITSTLAEMLCPECRQPTRRIHSRYTRLVERNLSLESCSLTPTLGGSRKHLLVTVVIPT